MTKIQTDDPVTFLQVISKNELGLTENLFELTLSQALGNKAKTADDIFTSSRLNKV